MMHGGYLYDGHLLAELRDDEIKALIKDLKKEGINNAIA